MLQLYNSLSGKIETFTSIEKNKVRLYVCGITPYDTTHLGHAFTYISFDLLVRTLSLLGFSVSYTQNVTDINDRDNDILKRAKEKNTTWSELAQFWTNKFLTDMKNLNWIMPNNYLKASENIPSAISVIEKILLNGFGYTANGSVFLDTSKLSNFGQLSGLSKDQMLLKAKEFEEDLDNPNKKNPLDITLWKSSTTNQPNHIPSFKSPWSMGRPGWHIECSAMAITSLGEQIDIHGGGIDLQYPHHESEIAQSECATNKMPFAKYWMHTAVVSINEQKMSKSLGNLILVSDLFNKYSANAIRFVLLSHHYKLSWSYIENEFEKAEVILKTIKRFSGKNGNKKNLLNKIKMELCNNLNSPSALQIIIDEVARGNGSGAREAMEIMGFNFNSL